MRIKRLDITGFKSFMDRSVFSFDEGVTGIVGPNGCGKSNVVDAIRWAMGEQSAKNLRGRGMEDVIFNGSESMPPLSMAEVTLTFKIEDGDVLGPQYAGLTDVSITRRLFRSGESEYQINKVTCRLLDITELFLGTGVGTRAYSIIEQGRVGQIVSARPEDRRSFIEEAAGVTKYKARRKAAERKMEYTQQNLLRVNDIVTELGKRLDSLNRQARKAEKYKKLKADMREIELHSASHRYLELHAERKVLGLKLESLTGEEKHGLDQVRELEDTIVARRSALDVEAHELEALAVKVHELESQVQLDEQNLSHWATDTDSTRKRVEQAREDGKLAVAREAELRASATSRQEELQALSTNWKEDDLNLKVLQEELRRVHELQAHLAERLDAERSHLVAVASRLANHESNLQNLGRRKADLEVRQAKCRAERDVLRVEEQRLDESRAQVMGQVGSTRQLALELAERKGREEESLLASQHAFAESEIQVICLREELADRRSRLTSLQEIQRNYEGFDRGVRAVMLAAGEQFREKGIFGLVADVVSTTPVYEKAIEAALGERLQHVIVESPAKGLELIEHLKTVSEGRSTFVPVQTDRPAPATAAPDLAREGVLAAARSEVKCEEVLSPVIDALLHDVVIVKDLAVAREYAASGGGDFVLVTLEGDVLRPGGSVTGGVLEGPAVGALQKKREISELSVEVANIEARYNETVTGHYTLQKQIGATEGLVKGLAKNQHAEELNLASQEKDLHKAAEDLSKMRERLTALAGEDRLLDESLVALATEEEAARGELAHGHNDREQREDTVRELSAELETLKAKGSSLADDLTALRVKTAAEAEKGEATRKEIEQLEAQGMEVRERIARLDISANEGDAHLAELAGRMAEAQVERTSRAEALVTQRASLDTRRAAHVEASSQTREQDVSLRELRGRLDELTQGLSQISLKERELALELEHLVAQIQERHQTDLGLELYRFHLLPALPAESAAQLKDLRAQVERMGEINLTAIEEHAEIVGRHTFLSAQKADLESSLEQLKSAIVKIDRTSRDRFKQTFEIVNDKFQQIFPRLFGGGRAGLVLTDEGPGQEQGVEIVAQPPGKKLQSVSLLSGGEKALTAVSLIFSIFLIKPTPFCLLDEVDAPLDEANVGRYNEMVREMCKQSQFIVITHNKRTMEVVDSLYGVTMEEPGISKLVSVRLREAVAVNTDQVA
jgi:chromosome segregation protein